MVLRNFSLVIISLLFVNLSFSQSKRVKFEKFSVQEGLSQSSVIDILQDNEGFIWFATLDGLNKYDGYEVKVYWNSPNKKNPIPDNIVNCLYETPANDEHTLWIGTASNGFCKYIKSKDNFVNYRKIKGDKNSLSNDIVTSITGKSDALWIATYKGLNFFNEKDNKFKHYFYNSSDKFSIIGDTLNVVQLYKENKLLVGTTEGLSVLDINTQKFTNFTEADGLPANDIKAFSVDQNGLIFIGTNNGLCSFDINTNQIINLTSEMYQSTNINDFTITSLLVDGDKSLWIGTATGGLIRHDIINKTYQLFVNDPSDNKSLSINSILSIYTDRSDILWVGTSLGGVNKWNRAAEDLAVFRHNPFDENSLSASQVRSVYTDKDSIVWIGTVEGGLNKWNVKTNEFEHYKNIPGNENSLSFNHVRSILEDSNSNFWVGTDGGGLNKFDRKTNKFKAYKHSKSNPLSISNNRVWKVYEDSKKRMWIGTYGGGINTFDVKEEIFQAIRHNPKDKSSLSSDLVTSILEDNKGNIWVGTFDGLNKLYPEGNKFLRYMYESANSNSLSNNRVYCLYQDSENYLWVGTKGGLNKFNIETEEFARFTTDNSDLPNNVILGILEDKENIWVSTNNGISRINKKTLKIKNFDMGDGLQSNEFLAGSFFKDKSGQMFFGGIDGFNAFYPKNIVDNPHIPPIVITNFKISNQEIELDSLVSVKKVIYLTHSQNDISFEFVALDFIFPEKNKYKYKLEGYDDDWNNNLFLRNAKYTNLAPGEYTFIVQGSNNDEVWNEKGASIKVIIKPAFWQTLTFKITSIVIIIVLMYIIYLIRVRQIKIRNKELEVTVIERTAEIRQQNEEILAQRDEIIEQKDKITKHTQEITSSIMYAKRIQTAALPSSNLIDKIIPNHFILFKPRDIVSGDFYWATQKDNKIIFTTADCTGHGVPGAFMSMLGISFLNKIVNENNITNSGEILNELRNHIINALNQNGIYNETKDGMDMTLCVIDTENNTLQFSAAFNSLFMVTDGEIIEYKAERMPVAIYDNMEPFSSQEIKIKKGDLFYLFSDGFADQFSSDTGKKFMKKRFRELLLSISEKDINKQSEILDLEFEKWRGVEQQVDDVVVFGVKI